MGLETLVLIPELTFEFILAILVLGIWELVWKGIALWKCGRNNQLTWFVFILILNTLGILPIIYLVFFQDKSKVEYVKVKKRGSKKKVAVKSAKKSKKRK